jgi:hypothetical protein
MVLELNMTAFRLQNQIIEALGERIPKQELRAL